VSARTSWHEARGIAGSVGISETVAVHEQVALEHCVGRRVTRAVIAPTDIPHFASSAMDGWAVCGEGPWALVLDQQLRDEPTASALEPGQARTIVTGALVPEGATAVLRSESGTIVGGVLHSTTAGEPRADQHLRPAGTEATSGETLIPAGVVLNPAHVALAASAGIDSLWVLPLPTVTLVLTGDEIVTSGIPGPGFVRDSFGIQLPQLVGMLGAKVVGVTRVSDDRESTMRALRDSTSPLIITTGGTGTSAADHVRSALLTLGARFHIDGIAMRPGGPTALAQLPDGQLVLALPGNPLAAMVALISLGEPVIAALSGRAPRPLRTVEGIDSIDVPGTAGSTRLEPYAIIDGRVTLSRWQGAGMMRGLATASGLLVVPEQGTVHGTTAESVVLPWLTAD
jgi:molybdopterin molybdotransferase